MIKIAGSGLDGLVASRFVELFGNQYEIANASLSTGVDISDPTALERFLTDQRPAYFINAAAFTNVNEAYNQRGDRSGSCYLVNVTGTANVAHLCAERKIPLIHLSTDYVFDGTKETAYTEADQPHPLEWYGETKAVAEQAVADSGVSAMILRLAFPYRAHFEAKPDIVAKLRAALTAGQLNPQFSDTLITPTLVDDIATAIKHSTTRFKPGIYHTVGSQSLSNFELAKLVATTFGLNEKLITAGSLTEYLKNNERPFHRRLELSNHKFSQEYKMSFATVKEGLNSVKVQLK
ncbi:MAG: sugar nucleotide-binding protein [bacterium]|nr:sugar nucleotide-binding protein [bacterium]